MIRWRVILTLFRKDLLQDLRDPSTLIVNYLLPTVFWAVAFIMFAGAISSMKTSKLAEKQEAIGYVGLRVPGLIEHLEERKIATIKVLPSPGPELGAALAELSGRVIPRATATVKEGQTPPKLLEKFASDHKLTGILFAEAGDPELSLYRIAYWTRAQSPFHTLEMTLRREIETHSQTIKKQRALELGISMAEYQPIEFSRREITSVRAQKLQTFSEFLPFMLIILLSMACTNLAMQTIVGEREKGTLGLLWSAPLRSSEIVASKLIHVIGGGMISVVINLANLVLGLLVLRSMTKIPLPMPVQAPFQVLLLVVCLAATTGSVIMVAAALAKDRNQAQGILSVSMVTVIGTFFAGHSMSLGTFTQLVPLLNIISGITHAIKEPLSIGQLLAILVSNILLLTGAIALANQLFKMVSAGTPFQLTAKSFGLPSNDPHLHRYLPSPGLAGLLLVTAFAGAIYLLSAVPFPYGPPTVQLMIFGVLPWLAVRKMRLSPALTFNLRPTNLRSLGGAIFIGVGMPLAVACVMAKLPLPEAGKEEIMKLMNRVSARGGYPLLIAYFAAMPAIFEEFFFRGIILNGLRKSLPAFWAVLLSSTAFGLIHLNPIQSIAATLGGFVMGAALLRSRSLIVTVIIHFLYNTMLLSIGEVLTALSGTAGSYTPPIQTLILVTLLGISFVIAGFFALKPVASTDP